MFSVFHIYRTCICVIVLCVFVYLLKLYLCTCIVLDNVTAGFALGSQYPIDELADAHWVNICLGTIPMVMVMMMMLMMMMVLMLTQL